MTLLSAQILIGHASLRVKHTHVCNPHCEIVRKKINSQTEVVYLAVFLNGS